MKNIKGTTRVCGLIGNPVKHSMSPLIHNALAEYENIDMAYVTFKVEEQDIEKALAGAYALNILGMNVTVPHKQNVISGLIDIDELAQNIGAVNTLVRAEGGYKGYNTDILGLQRELIDAGISLENSDIIIIGAGGAARAISFLCAKEKANSITIINRTRQKAILLANEVNNKLGVNIVKGIGLQEYSRLSGKKYIVLQTTSVGLHPDIDTALIEDDEFYDLVEVGVDIIYNPAKTKFMKLVEAKGKKAYNGLKMLLYQGVSAFELWNNIQVDEHNVQKVYELMKKELEIVE